MKIDELFKQYSAPFASRNRGNEVSAKELAQAAQIRAHFLRDKGTLEILAAGTNTIPAGLQRAAVVQAVLSDFARRLAPLSLFSTIFQDVPLEGTNKVEVPYYELDASASTSFDATEGYVAGDTATSVREIQVGKRATADVDDDTKPYNRLYQAMAFSSEEIARQPFLKTVELARQKTDKLASDIITHILGVVTAANYGAPVFTGDAAAFDSDDVVDIKLACKTWPDSGRSLLLASEYDAALLKDGSFKAAYAAGTDRAIKDGKLFPRVMGFDYSEWPTIPDNSENLVGFAAFKSAIITAFAPVPPLKELRDSGTAYEYFVHPETGVVLEYRSFGNSQMDTGTHIVESSYGFAKGNGNALKRIASQ